MNEEPRPLPVMRLSPIRTSHPNLGAFYGALARAQAKFPTITKNHTAHVTSKEDRKKVLYSYTYADLADVVTAIRPILAAEGIATIQAPVLKDGNMVLVTRLAHESGQWIEADYPVGGTGMAHQAIAGNLTYAKRYSLSAMTNVVAEEDIDAAGVENDDDGGGDRFERGEPIPAAAPPRPPRPAGPARQQPTAGWGDPLLDEARTKTTAAALVEWHKSNASTLRAKPQDWQDEFYPRYEAMLVALRSVEK